MKNEVRRAIILHGTGGTPQSNWFPWLAANLTKEKFEVLVPRFPTPQGQSLKSWMEAFHAQVGELRSTDVLIGHSMGVGLLLRVLEQSPTAVSTSIFVAGWTGLLGLPDFDPLIESFFRDEMNFNAIKSNMGQAIAFHGENDPYVPLQLGQSLADRLGIQLVSISKGGHLNAESGFLKFDPLLSYLLKT